MPVMIAGIGVRQLIRITGDPLAGPVPCVLNPGDALLREDTDQYYLMTTTGIVLGAPVAAVHPHDASTLVSGVVAPARLGTGTPDVSKVLRGDGTWAAEGGTPDAHGPTHHAGGSDALSLASVAGTITVGQHGSPAGDLHPTYALDADLATHEAAADPHVGYQRESEKGAALGYADLDAATLVPIARLPLGSTSATVAVGNDARLSDARTPTAHTHPLSEITDEGALAAKNTVATGDIDNDAVTYAKLQNVSVTDRVLGRATAGAGDAEEIVCTAAGRALIDDADAAAQRTTLGAAATSHTHVSTDITGTAVLTADSRLSDARTPTAHAASHKSAGSDAIKLDEFAAPTDVTTLNASATAHGLLAKLSNVSTQFLDGTGAFSTPVILPSLARTFCFMGA